MFVSFRCLFPRNGRSARIEVSAMTQAQVRDCPSGKSGNEMRRSVREQASIQNQQRKT